MSMISLEISDVNRGTLVTEPSRLPFPQLAAATVRQERTAVQTQHPCRMFATLHSCRLGLDPTKPSETSSALSRGERQKKPEPDPSVAASVGTLPHERRDDREVKA